MYSVLQLNAISPKINEVFNRNYSLENECANPDAIMLRSFQMADYEIGSKLLAVGRAGAGVNNIPLKKMADAGVAVFNTPGANANAVKELVILALLLSSRDVLGGVSWANTLVDEGENVAKVVEKGKGKFGGVEIFGKTLGVIGLGAIGVLVANAATALGMKVVGYDPMLSEKTKKSLSPEVKVMELDGVFAAADYITLHVPLVDSTRNIICEANLAVMKNGVTILNFSRAELANVSAVKGALASGKMSKYIVDFPTLEVLNTKGIVAIPHLGASTEEAEDNCAVMAAAELKDYLENGNVTNSVNFPALNVPRNGERITVVSGADTAASISQAASGFSVSTKVRDSVGYTIIDGNGAHALADTMKAIGGVLKVREL